MFQAKSLRVSTFALVALTPFTGGPAEGSSDPPTTTATVTIGSTKGNSVSSTFAGLSYEKSILSEPFFIAGNMALTNLFKMLGPGILRVGGNYVNATTWSATGAINGIGYGAAGHRSVGRFFVRN